MSSTSSDNNGDSTFEVISDKDLNNGAEKQQLIASERVHKSMDAKKAANVEQEKTGVQVSTPIHIPKPTNVSYEMQDVNLSQPSSMSPTKADNAGFLGWLSSNQFLNQVAKKARNSVDTMITTLDPGMKEFLRGDVSIVVSSTDDVKVTAVRDAFIDTFGRATVKGVESHASSIAIQPFGVDSAVGAAKERIYNIRTEQSSVVPQNQVIVSVENVIFELSPEKFYNFEYLLLDDPLISLSLDIYSQSIWIPSECVNRLKFETPSDYVFRDSGFSLTIDEIMAQKLNVARDKWHDMWTGLSRNKIIYNAAFVLANLYKVKLSRQ